MGSDILSFDAVTLPATDRYDEEIGGITFSVKPGEALLVEVEDERVCPPIADTAAGLMEPVAGRVLFDGVDWSDMGPDASVDCRSRIGCVFEEQAWVSNLDVDENVTLAQRHHTGRAATEILQEALDWARRFGRDALPAGRPAWVPQHELRIAQWVRALLGEPRLLILERPTRDTTDAELDQLIEAVATRRAQGVAAVWLSSDERIVKHAKLAPTYRARVTGGKWEIME